MLLLKLKLVPAVEESKPSEVKKEEVTESPKVESKKETTPTGERASMQASELDNQPPILKGAAPAAPSVRRIAREIGVDINKVPGSRTKWQSFYG